MHWHKRLALPLTAPLALAEAEGLLAIHGRNELEEKSTPKWLVFVRLVRG
jgi:hypothetical protein